MPTRRKRFDEGGRSEPSRARPSASGSRGRGLRARLFPAGLRSTAQGSQCWPRPSRRTRGAGPSQAALAAVACLRCPQGAWRRGGQGMSPPAESRRPWRVWPQLPRPRRPSPLWPGCLRGCHHRRGVVEPRSRLLHGARRSSLQTWSRPSLRPEAALRTRLAEHCQRRSAPRGCRSSQRGGRRAAPAQPVLAACRAPALGSEGRLMPLQVVVVVAEQAALSMTRSAM